MKSIHIFLIGTALFGGAWAVAASPGQAPQPTRNHAAPRVTPEAAEFFE
jgi:hypothetical protein